MCDIEVEVRLVDLRQEGTCFFNITIHKEIHEVADIASKVRAQRGRKIKALAVFKLQELCTRKRLIKAIRAKHRPRFVNGMSPLLNAAVFAFVDGLSFSYQNKQHAPGASLLHHLNKDLRFRSRYLSLLCHVLCIPSTLPFIKDKDVLVVIRCLIEEVFITHFYDTLDKSLIMQRTLQDLDQRTIARKKYGIVSILTVDVLQTEERLARSRNTRDNSQNMALLTLRQFRCLCCKQAMASSMPALCARRICGSGS